jgi:hypothetical protein
MLLSNHIRVASASGLEAPADPGQADLPDPASRAAAELADLKSRVSAARLLIPINNWEFAARVWTGLRPHLRTRLWVLEALQAREHVSESAQASESSRLGDLAIEIRRVEAEVDQVLARRSCLTEFSSLLEHRLAPCLGQLETLQQALHARHDH